MEAMLLEAIHASNDGFPKNKCRFAVYSDLHQNWFFAKYSQSRYPHTECNVHLLDSAAS